MPDFCDKCQVNFCDCPPVMCDQPPKPKTRIFSNNRASEIRALILDVKNGAISKDEAARINQDFQAAIVNELKLVRELQEEIYLAAKTQAIKFD